MDTTIFAQVSSSMRPQHLRREPQEFAESVSGRGAAVHGSFDTNEGRLAAPSHGSCATLEVVATATRSFDAVVLQKDLTKG